MITGFTTDLAILLITVTVLAFLARKTKQPTIVAYVITGLLLGPIGYALVTHGALPYNLSGFLDGPLVSEDHLINIIAELGLGFLLFLLGIELSFDKVREILRPVGFIAVGQAILQGVASTSVALLLGFDLFTSLMIALATTFGATPIIVKVLGDKDELDTLYGRVDVGILIFQDLYLVIALAILSVGTLSGLDQIIVQTARVFFMIFVIGTVAYLASKYILPSILREGASNLNTLMIIGTAWVFIFIASALYFEVSVEIGAFLAGLALAQSRFSTELKERLYPVTNFFIVVFFASIGLTIDMSSLLVYWKEAVIACILLLGINFCIVFGLYISQNFDLETSFLGTISMLQVSEFSLVLGALAVQQGFVEPGILGFLTIMAIITMPASTYYVMYNREIYERVKPYLKRFEREDAIKDVDKGYKNHALLIGYNERMGDLIPTLSQNYDEVVLVDNNSENAKEIAKKDVEYLYGDFKHAEMRKEGRIKKADLIISTVSDKNLSHQIISDSMQDSAVFLEADSQEIAAELYERGADYVVMENDITGEEIANLIEIFIRDRKMFENEIQDTIERIHWGGRKDG